jgi:putative redox protein
MGKKQQNVTSLEIKVHGDRVNDHPRIYKKLFVEYVIGGIELDPKAVDRSVQLSVEKYCSVQAMLGVAVPIEHKITIL